ncbi:hypothetical protein O181_038036 [Austropuccinia psidii MF-1]|uniref:Uncharacterized protein n=1 Tax=Austropuccinia psidii MF-1 TaxID=1389203 RepID=A0A9Q3DD91_9BASI|nr:hypothetical protein [Austropuccinia psidii MF-1]
MTGSAEKGRWNVLEILESRRNSAQRLLHALAGHSRLPAAGETAAGRGLPTDLPASDPVRSLASSMALFLHGSPNHAVQSRPHSKVVLGYSRSTVIFCPSPLCLCPAPLSILIVRLRATPSRPWSLQRLP